MISDIITLAIIAFTVFVSYNCFNDRSLFMKLELSPFRIARYKEFYRFITYGFVHADWAHLFINMFVFYSFADVVYYFAEFHFQKPALFFVGLYFGGLVMSTVFSFFKHRNNYAYAAVGASGAVSSIVFASILFYPAGSIRLFLIPIDIPSWMFGVMYLIYSVVMARRAKDNVGHDAHLFGAIFGLVFPILLKFELLNIFIYLVF
jgi:membrane associated rhomboid family serine protease